MRKIKIGILSWNNDSIRTTYPNLVIEGRWRKSRIPREIPRKIPREIPIDQSVMYERTKERTNGIDVESKRKSFMFVYVNEGKDS